MSIAIPDKYGVRKVNIDIDIDLRLASTGAMRRLMATNPSDSIPVNSSALP